LEELEIDLNALLDDRNEEKEKKTRIIGHFWASEFGKCHRQVYYSFTCPQEHAAERRRVFDVGNLIHAHIQALLKKREGSDYLNVWNEKYVTINDIETPLIITGKIDTVLIPKTGEPFILEFKSVNERAFKKKVSVQYSHRCQTILYLRSQQMSHGYVVYISKDDMRVNMLRVDYDEELFQRLIREARYLLSCLQQCKLPSNQPKFPFECSYCPYQKNCKNNDNPALHARLFPTGGEAAKCVEPVKQEEVKPDGVRSQGNPKDDLSGLDEGNDLHDKPEIS
jgi:CRISPR/Cas system-associated exonuclease Cas4 (RecB family)